MPLVAAAALALGFAPAPAPRTDGKADLMRMQGRWELVADTVAGVPVTAGGVGRWHMAIAAGRLSRYLASGLSVEYALTLNAVKAPKRYSISTRAGEVLRGIYNLEGGVLTLCHNDWGKGPPEAFDGPKAGKCIEVFKREAKP
jgi:uncharacterized protein (TIGR03067 family)